MVHNTRVINFKKTKKIIFGPKGLKSFTFDSIIPTSCRLENNLSGMSPSCLYHLRQAHPVIDAVCIAKDSVTSESYHSSIS